MFCIEGKSSNGNPMNLYIGICKGSFNVRTTFEGALKFYDRDSAQTIIDYLKQTYPDSFQPKQFEITEHLAEETTDRLIFGFNKEDVQNYNEYLQMPADSLSSEKQRLLLFEQLPLAFKIDVTTNRDKEKNFIMKKKETIKKMIQEAGL